MKDSQSGSTSGIGLQYDQASTNRSRLWMHGTGIGISAGDLLLIFERFVWAKNFNRSINGLGIGPSIAHELVIQHSGSIWAESQEDADSTFYVALLRHSPTNKV